MRWRTHPFWIAADPQHPHVYKVVRDHSVYSAEDTALREIFYDRGLGPLIDIDDDIYARMVVADGRFRAR